MIKLITFDLDGTLAELGAGILAENLQRLHLLEEKGYRIAICSGKPTYYLCGLLRQVGLKQPVLAGENGAVIQLGIDLPPKDFYIQDYSKEAKDSIRYFSRLFEEEEPELWYQPNLVGLTPFPKDEETFERVQKLIDDNADHLIDVDVYRHIDCFDIVPQRISKKTGLEFLGRILDIKPEEVVCVGDGVNDYPMFEYAGLALGIHFPDEDKVDHNFPTIGDALQFLLDM